MKKKLVKFLVLFPFSILLIISSQVFAQASSSKIPTSNSAFFDKTFLQNVAVAVLSAILAFVGGYALAGINNKQGSKKKLSYNSTIEKNLVNIANNIQEKVKVTYEGEEIKTLSHIKFDVENTGTTVVKSQEIRFEFPEGTRILDFSFDPIPTPEMKVDKISDPALREFERKCIIGHIEKNQKVGIRFTVTSDKDVIITPHPYNEYGDVDFITKTATKALSEREQVAKFLSLLIMYFVIPPVFSLFSPLNENMAGLIRLLILSILFRFIVPFAEVIAELISKWLSFEQSVNQAMLSDVKVGGNFTVESMSQEIQSRR